jgi:hypothetical protein
LQELNKVQVKDLKREGIYYKRVSRVYQTISIEDEGRNRRIPTVFLIKPNKARYWTSSMALRDADEVSMDIYQWSKSTAQGFDSYE